MIKLEWLNVFILISMMLSGCNTELPDFSNITFVEAPMYEIEVQNATYDPRMPSTCLPLKNHTYKVYNYKNVTVKLADNVSVDYEALLDKANENHLKGINEIVFFPTSRLVIQYGEDKYCERTSRGMYTLSFKNIALNAGHLEQDTVLHEIGHHFWFWMLKGYERAEWCSEYADQEIFVSSYSKQDCYENFAEEYMTYMKNPDELMENKRELMERWMNSKEYNGDGR